MSQIKCLNPWDPQSKRQYEIDGIYATLNAGQSQGGQAHGICYAIEGNVVDRVSSKNGKGWCEDVSPTLNTQDRHAVCIALEGNGARPSHMGKGFSDDGTMYTLNTIEQHSVCYAIENHPADSRVTMDDSGIVQTLSARMGTGGGNTPMVLINSSGNGIATTIDANYYKGCGQREGLEREFIMTDAYCAGNGQLVQAKLHDVVNCLDCMHDQKMVLINKQHYYTKQAHGEFIDGKVASSLKRRDYKEYTDLVQEDNMEENNRKYVLRRLTPIECARLQGFPDWWCEGANGSDSAQYKLWGNGIALPCAVDVLGRIAEEMRKDG